MTCLQTVLSVSKTPTPLSAQASTTGDSVWLSSSVRSATEKMSLRSRLFICSTTPSLLRSSPWPTQVVPQVEVAVDVLVQPRYLAVGHEHHAVGALQHQLAGRVVERLARARCRDGTGCAAP